MDIQKKIEILKNSEIFYELSEKLLLKIADIVYLQNFKSDNIIFHEGDSVKGFYIVTKGKVKAIKISIEGREHIIKFCHVGDVCAESIVFGIEKYPITLKAIENSTLLYISKKQFINLLKQEPDLSISLISILSKRVHFLVKIIEDLSLKEVSGRISNYLLDQAIEQYSELKNNMKLELPISKRQLSANLGTIPETLSRTLKKWNQKI